MICQQYGNSDGCTKQYRCALDIYLMNVLSYLYVIIMDCAINSPGNGNYVVGRLNAKENHYLKEQMELIGKLAIINTSNIGILLGASK